jgi:hypothetical protein
MAQTWRIPRRTQSFAAVHFPRLNWPDRPSLFAIVRIGRICKQGVVGSSPIVSTQSDQVEQRDRTL